MLKLFTTVNTSILSGVKDLAMTLPPRLYITTALPRLLTQILFFSLLGEYLGGKSLLLYALVGNAVVSMATPAMVEVAQDLARTLRSGTLPLLVSSPTNVLWPIGTWGSGQLLMGLSNSIIGLFILAPLVGVSLKPSALLAIPVLMLTLFSLYGLGLVLGALCLKVRGAVLISNSVVFILYSLAGVNFPISALPPWLQSVSWVLPLSHGLLAIRALVEGTNISTIPIQLIQEAGIGIIYWFLGLVLFLWQIQEGRRNGNLDFYS